MRKPGEARQQRAAADSSTEKQIQADILGAVATRTDVRIWRANTGVARTMDFRAVVRFGVVGQADLTGILLGSGRRLEVEVKAPGGVQTTEQKKYQAMIVKFGGVYIVAHSAAEAVAGVEAALRVDAHLRGGAR